MTKLYGQKDEMERKMIIIILKKDNIILTSGYM